VVSDVPVDDKAPVVTSRISRSAGAQSFRGAHRGRVCVRVVTVAPQVLGSTPVGANFSGFNGVCAFSGSRRSRRQRGACGDFVNLDDLPAQSSKMLLGVGFACVYS
jgi:hypothetical protein